ncbi:MAG: hypothetical protein U7126_04855 [Microcoleus sp.]
MLSAERLSEQGVFPGTVAGISAGIPDLLVPKEDLLNQMAGIKVGATMAAIDARDDLTQKSDFGAAATVGSIALSDSFSDFGLLVLGGDSPQFENSLKSQPDISGKVQRDELTGMDFAVGDGVGEQLRSASRTASLIPSENGSFDFQDYTIEHQGLNTLNIKVDYELKPGIAQAEYPDTCCYFIKV